VIQNFLADAEVLGLLTNPFSAFPGASAQTKAIFETKTSAINVTPSSVARYDIKEIKEDAIWLSNAAKIDEVTALRIVVEECQSRASAQLLGPFSEEELSSIREAAGNGKYTSPIPMALLSQGASAETIKKEFDSKDSRRQRILLSYLSERQNFLKCVERLLHGFFLSASSAQDDKGKGKGAKVTTWVADSGKAIVDKLDANQKDTFVLQGIEYIVTNIKNIETGSDWFSEDGGREVVELGWIRNQIAEATHAMEIIWNFLVYVIGCPSSRVALEWFKLQQACQWFNSFSMVRCLFFW
jgi:nuclear pore complex protein Nup188